MKFISLAPAILLAILLTRFVFTEFYPSDSLIALTMFLSIWLFIEWFFGTIKEEQRHED